MAQVSCCQLDEEEFRKCCLQLLQRSEELRDGWSWQQPQGSEDGYLKKTTLRCVSVTSKRSKKNQQDSALLIDSDCRQNQSAHVSAAPEEATDDADDEDVADDADVPACSACESSFLQFEYHVVFSCSYSSPVLYFRAFTLEGRSLTLEEVWSSIHPNFRLHLQENPLNAVSQQEHPLLGQPFFLLHPCRTEEFMKPLLQMAQQHHSPAQPTTDPNPQATRPTPTHTPAPNPTEGRTQRAPRDPSRGAKAHAQETALPKQGPPHAALAGMQVHGPRARPGRPPLRNILRWLWSIDQSVYISPLCCLCVFIWGVVQMLSVDEQY
ncbi:ubiquitin-like-conjugating enzyme ATG10 isoform X2 [Gouania willdenowi]|nr:ubiquitin-like-conjugating enzyme ATG10 isoform X2 [Gouania willdenowi]